MTMNYRGEFEKLFPVPPGVKWCERQQDYTYENYRNLYAAASYSSGWKVWQAALAQSGQSEGAIAEVVSVSPMDCTAIVKWRPELNGNVPQAIWNLGTKLYTHPQPAQQGSVEATTDSRLRKAMQMPLKELASKFLEATDRASRNMNALKANQQAGAPEGWRECLAEMVQAMHDYEMSVDEGAPYKHRAMMDRAHALLSTTPQPEGNGWVKCSERLPTEEDQYVWVYFKDHGVSEALWRWDDDIGAYGETHWMPTGLKFPQPPQEGE